MKKTISLFLALVLLMSVFSLVFADEIGEQYYTVKVEYSDNVGKKEQLNLMVQGYNVYVDAKMLAERFGYTFGENGNCAVIFNKDMSNGLRDAFPNLNITAQEFHICYSTEWLTLIKHRLQV